MPLPLPQQRGIQEVGTVCSALSQAKRIRIGFCSGQHQFGPIWLDEVRDGADQCCLIPFSIGALFTRTGFPTPFTQTTQRPKLLSLWAKGR